MYAAWLYKLPELAESLKNDYEHKKDLNEKFHDMKEVMRIAQDNNTELEASHRCVYCLTSNQDSFFKNTELEAF